jgi:hypothetical protein
VDEFCPVVFAVDSFMQEAVNPVISKLFFTEKSIFLCKKQ